VRGSWWAFQFSWARGLADHIIGQSPKPGELRPSHTTLHATTVTLGGRGLLITGKSGSGKSGLALQLVAYGAMLVSDDQTFIQEREGVLVASAPPAIAGQIEARGLGILSIEYANQSVLVAVVDMEPVEKDRLPPLRDCSILGVRLPLIYKTEAPYFPAAILQYLKAGRSA